MKDESLVNADRARHELGGQRKCRSCGPVPAPGCSECGGAGVVPTPWSRGYMTQLKKAMGIKGRYFLLADVRKFLRDNPDFTCSKSSPTDTFKAMLAEVVDYLQQRKPVPNALVERIERKLAC